MKRRPTAVVTGAGARVGRAIALELGRAGFSVVVHHRGSHEGAAAVVAEIDAAGGEAVAISADLATEEGCRSLVTAVGERFERLHVLVNNASIYGSVPFAEITANQWEAMHAVNLRAPFFLSQGLLPLLEEGLAADLGGPPGQGGLVVQMCDIGGERPQRGYAAYATSKAGLVMLVKAMAVELAPKVRTIGLSPGQILWPDDYDAALRERLAARIPMRRADGVDDVARLVRFVATEAFYLNGDVIAVDGGLSARY